MRRVIVWLLLLLAYICDAEAQQFFNLTSDEVKVDSILPCFCHSFNIGREYSDSTYTIQIEYPEYIDMTVQDIKKYKSISKNPLPYTPEINQSISIDRKKASLDVKFIPLVYRDGKYKKLISFMLRLTSNPISKSKKLSILTRSTTSNERYISHSVLASGQWAKIRVPASGVYQITQSLIQKAGFTDISKVKIYGYGGALQPELLTDNYIRSTDDLKEVMTCNIGGKKLFYAKGPVSWTSPNTKIRTRNPYSDYGYYLITQQENKTDTVDSTTFVNSFYPSGDDYHTLYEIDNYSWYAGGRNLFDEYKYTVGSSKSYTLASSGLSSNGTITVALTANALTIANVSVNDSIVGSIIISKPGNYDVACESTMTFALNNIHSSNTVKIVEASGGNMRLDYISLYYENPNLVPQLTAGSFPQPDYIYKMTNQDLHADSAYDMVIIVPSSGKLTAQAEKLKTLHQQRDSMRVRIVPADELYNEFSSGTPDANAYRRYMKMLYDKATTERDMPRYLILFGDGAWDNRMLTSDWKQYNPDDYLLCYESENSFSETECYVDDGYFCLLDDGEGSDLLGKDKPDIAVGRFPVRDAAQAKIMVDKATDYRNNKNAGSWQTSVCILGDDGTLEDGDQNIHMIGAENVAKIIETSHPEFIVKRIMWDAYNRVTTSTGNRYPEVQKIIKQNMSKGALMFNYTGHGSPDAISHEYVLTTNDFKEATSMRLPLWVTASCDIMPFDGQIENIGEQAVLNPNGGAIAFYGTTRTVYSNYNLTMNNAFTSYVLSTKNGIRNTIGEAVRMAKNELINKATDTSANKLQYTLLGDPALALPYPQMNAYVDSINGISVNSGKSIQIKSGSRVNVKGHIENNSILNTSFNGILTSIVRDCLDTVVCKNNVGGSGSNFTYTDRPNTLYVGNDSVKNGSFSFLFAVTKDINYTNSNGMINLYAVNNDFSQEASGYNDNFILGGSDIVKNDSLGPSIYCYLNSPSFENNATVNRTPYFLAQVMDNDGINSAGSGIGHDIELIIDGDMSQTYILNDYFKYDFGSYTSGSVGYSIPELAVGRHKLKFRVWDILNNSSTSELDFNVESGLSPKLFSVGCTNNPASTSTTFIINHDRAGSNIDIELDIFDLSGRQLYKTTTNETPSTNTSTLTWDITTDGGARLQTGVYLYRIRIKSDSSEQVSKAQKLIVINN